MATSRVLALALVLLLLLLTTGCAQQQSSAWPVFGRTSGHGSLSDVSGPTALHVFWNTSLTAEIHGAISIAQDDTIYVGDESGTVYAIISEGSIKWTYNSNKYAIHSAPAVDAEGNLFYGSNDNDVYSISSTGVLRWKFITGGPIDGSAAFDSQGHILIGTKQQYLYSLFTNGSQHWNQIFNGFIYSTPAVGPDDAVYVVAGGLNALSSAGAISWRVPSTLTSYSSPVVTSDTVYVVLDYYMRSYSFAGVQKWQVSVGKDTISATPALDSATLYIGNVKDTFYAISTEGAVMWTYSTGDEASGWPSSPVVAANSIVYAGNSNGYLYALRDGELVFKFDTGKPMLSSPAISQRGVVYAASGQQLYALSPPCSAGSYITPEGDEFCTDCPVGEYSDSANAVSCTRCSYPWTTRSTGETACLALSMYISWDLTVAALGALAGLLLVCMCSSDQRVAVLVNLFFPTLDVFSDLTYVLTNEFYSAVLFTLCCLSILLPSWYFYRVLQKHRVAPRLWWGPDQALWLRAGSGDDCIPHPVAPFLTGSGGRLPVLSQEEHSGFLSVVLECLAWVVAIVAQAITLVVLVPGSALFLALWMLLGSFLHLTKVLAIGRVWNIWVRAWSQSESFVTNVDVDTAELLSCLEQDFYVETLPQFVLQLTNAILLGRLSPIAAFSLTMSVFMSVNGIWRFLYHRYFANDKKQAHEIPMRMRLGCGKWVLFDVHLVTGSKKGAYANLEKEDTRQPMLEGIGGEGARDGGASVSKDYEEQACAGAEYVAPTMTVVLPSDGRGVSGRLPSVEFRDSNGDGPRNLS